MTEPGKSDVIHRLKNQICIIVGFSELLLVELAEGDRHRADVQEIHRAAQSAMAIVPEVARARRERC